MRNAMKINRNNGHWIVAGLAGTAELINRCRKNAREFVRIQTALVYLKGVDVVRTLFLYQIGVLVCVIFLVFGVVLIEAAGIFYFPMEFQARIHMAFIVGFLDSLTALIFLGYFASSRRWLHQAAKYNSFVEEFMEDKECFRRMGKIRKEKPEF